MAKAGFTRNSRAIAGILHNDAGGQAAVRAAAAQMEANIRAKRGEAESHGDEVFVSEYHTDRFVCGVNVPAVDQAENGSATRAAGEAGLTPGR